MGLRAASVRHPNAVVMAPALTEAGQSQNFSLPPSSPINNSVSQKQNGGGYVLHDDDENHMCKDRDLVSKHSYLDGPFNVNETKTSLRIKLQAASDNDSQPSQQTTNIIMNTDVDTMGLQKTGMDSMATLIKDKTVPNDVEQLFNNLTSAVDMAAGGDLGQNVDDLMQVIKNMEGKGDAETEAMFPIAFDRELFEEVGMMNTFEDEMKEHRAREMLDELHKKQAKLERRSEFLLRRIRKIQARNMGQHVSSEVAGLYEYVHRTLKRVKEEKTLQQLPASPLEDEQQQQQSLEQQQTLNTTDLKAISSHATRNLARKLHMTSVQQSSVSNRHKHVSKYFGSGSSEPASTSTPVITLRNAVSFATVSVPRFADEVRDELEKVAGTLQTELSLVEAQVDSDATASSSGAESCDEMQTYNNPHQHFLSISKRAAWRYGNERAAVASRWTWLQAQISDLEYRIRQHNELHRQIRACKGTVALGAAAAAAATTSCITSTTSSTTSSPQMSPSAVNGYRGQLPGATGKTGIDDLANGAVPSSGTSNNSTSGTSARTRPLNRTTFRKRKLLQTTGLHTVSKKASRPSNIRCGCVSPAVPCALCTGREDPTFPRDVPELMTVQERIALLDPGYHPVLSFSDDVSQSIHLDAIMKLSDWQQKSLRCNMKSLKGISKAEKLSGGLDNRPKKLEHRKKYNRLLKSSTANALSTKIKSKMGRGRRPFGGRSGASLVRMSSSKKRHNAKMAIAQLNALASESMDELEMEALNAIGGGANKESLTPSPLGHVQVVPYKRNRVDSYDIDNIVIPYSVAASTRVEKLQYKEILTPKWRVIDNDFPAKYDIKNNGIVRRVSQDSDVEDITDETLSSRHEKCEHDEKKKFLSYIKFPLTAGGRSRANRRTDSRAESSGANTPDPMSPHTGDNSETAANSPLTSPPATPLNILQSTDTNDLPSSLQFNARRRTISQTTTPLPLVAMFETVENAPTPPYETRTFPLTDDIYETMLKFMPEGHSIANYSMSKQSSHDSDVAAESPFAESSRADTPISDSTESALAEEDPNDPEWLDVERVRERTKR